MEVVTLLPVLETSIFGMGLGFFFCRGNLQETQLAHSRQKTVLDVTLTKKNASSLVILFRFSFSRSLV